MGTTESSMNYEAIYNQIQSQMSSFEHRLSIMEARMYSFEEMEYKMQQINEVETKLRRLESIEARMTKLEISLQKALSTFLPRVDKILESIDNPSSNNQPPVSLPPENSRNEEPAPITLIEAAKKGDVVTIERLVSGGTSVEEIDDHQETALFHAVRGGHVEAVENLLGYGADVNAFNDPEEQSPLMLAALEGHKRISELLVTFGTELEDEDAEGNTCLWYAASGGHIDIVRLLIQKGAVVDYGEPYNPPATMILEIAAKKGHADVVKAILTLSSGWSSIDLRHALNATDSPEVVRAISEVAPHEVWGECGGRALLDAARNNRAGAVEGLLRAGANIAFKNVNGLTPLHFAASYESIGAIVSLVVHGADIEAQDSKGRTPLHLAAIHKREKSIKALLAKNANRNAFDKRGRIPFDVVEDPYIEILLRVG